MIERRVSNSDFFTAIVIRCSKSLQLEERQVGHVNVNLDIDIFVISEPKWLKFGLQACFFKIFGYAKFQLSIFFTIRVENF